MTVASLLGYGITDKNYMTKHAILDIKKAKPVQAIKKEINVVSGCNIHLEEVSSDESDEDQYTDLEDEDKEPTSYEEEYMDEVETLIRMEERLEKQ